MLRKITFGLIALSSIVAISAFIPRNPLADKIPASGLKTIVIDPGHGGSDAGAIGSFSKEKDICLAVCLKVGDLLKKEMPDVKVLFTRTTDIFPTLRERADFANENRGDLFVSVHVNSAPPLKKSEVVGTTTRTRYVGKGKKRRKITEKVPKIRYYTEPNPAKGTETYIWGAHKSGDKEIALRENAPMLMEENTTEKYGPVDPNSNEFMVMASLKAKQFFKRSATLAMHVEEEFVKVGRASRDLKQRQVGIWVLQATAMPSILIETGFISNKEEEIYLNSEEGQSELARCIVTALKRYKAEIDSSQVGSRESASAPIQNDGGSKQSEPVANKEMLLPKK